MFVRFLCTIKKSSSCRIQSFSSSSGPLPSTLTRSPPIRSLVPPGECQFDENFTAVRLLEKYKVSPTSFVLRFELPDSKQPLGLSTCACLLARPAYQMDDDLIRPYTPISTNAQVGSFDLLIKRYPKKETPSLSRYLTDLTPGQSAEFQHIPPNVKVQVESQLDPLSHIGMIAGGTGITPMLQALHALLGNPQQRISLVYASRTRTDILAEELLHHWSLEYRHSFELTHVLSDDPESNDSLYLSGYVTRGLLEEHLGGADMVLVCGPPPMYEAVCGPRDESVVTGYLAQLGYSSNQVYKF